MEDQITPQISNKGGRPTEYTDKLSNAVYEYVSYCLNKAVGEDPEMPTIQGFSLYIHYSLQAINEWEKKYAIFGEALEFLRSNQCVQLINRGLNNKGNTVITKLMLMNNHDYREKSEQKVDQTMDVKGKLVYIPQQHEERVETTPEAREDADSSRSD